MMQICEVPIAELEPVRVFIYNSYVNACANILHN